LIAHGGGIEAASMPGKGASFRFWVPLVEKEPVVEPAKVHVGAQQAAAKRRKRSGAKAGEDSAQTMDAR
jgi:hypothetical protein